MSYRLTSVIPFRSGLSPTCRGLRQGLTEKPLKANLRKLALRGNTQMQGRTKQRTAQQGTAFQRLTRLSNRACLGSKGSNAPQSWAKNRIALQRSAKHCIATQ